jgi:hypothetical protein
MFGRPIQNTKHSSLYLSLSVYYTTTMDTANKVAANVKENADQAVEKAAEVLKDSNAQTETSIKDTENGSDGCYQHVWYQFKAWLPCIS